MMALCACVNVDFFARQSLSAIIRISEDGKWCYLSRFIVAVDLKKSNSHVNEGYLNNSLYFLSEWTSLPEMKWVKKSNMFNILNKYSKMNYFNIYSSKY